jgi:uncharacterized protein (DUF305 family)
MRPIGQLDAAPWHSKHSQEADMTGSRSHVRVLLPALALILASCSAEPQSLADYIAAICTTPFRSASADEAPYLAENVSAMTKMMIDMGIRPTGDVDKDFVAMMTPHHQGAIDTAMAELRHGHNERLRRMAQEIIVTQQQEIAAMRLAVGQLAPPSLPSADRLSAAERADAKSVHYYPAD